MNRLTTTIMTSLCALFLVFPICVMAQEKGLCQASATLSRTINTDVARAVIAAMRNTPLYKKKLEESDAHWLKHTFPTGLINMYVERSTLSAQEDRKLTEECYRNLDYCHKDGDSRAVLQPNPQMTLAVPPGIEQMERMVEALGEDGPYFFYFELWTTECVSGDFTARRFD